MRRRVASLGPVLLVIPLIWSTVAFGQSGQTSESVWDGVYTSAQAARGQQVYTQHCVECHESDMQGNGEAPALVGGQFVSDFDGETLRSLWHLIHRTMPQNAPESLSPKMYAEVLAYILQANGFPAGSRKLSDRGPFLTAIEFQAVNPHPNRSPATAVAKPAASASLEARAPSTTTRAHPRRTGFVRVPPANLAALAAANKASGVLSPAASNPRNAPNSQPDPYRAVTHFLKLPRGRVMGSTSSVALDSQGHIWVVDRCGANSCAGSALAPIMEFDAKGNFIKAFGAGMFVFPHSIYIDSKDHIWVVDERAEDGKGADVIEFNEDGKVLRILGKPGVSHAGRDSFFQPTAVVVAPDGDIFVADGHTAGPGHTDRVVKFTPQGRFLMQWGHEGMAAGELDVPHCLAIDKEGRIYVGDRWNNRIQVFSENGRLLSILTQFGRPSGCYIDKHNILYVTDSESRSKYGYGYDPGWKRGIRIGSVHTGIVTAFIPVTALGDEKYATFGGEGIWAGPNGAVYSAEVQQKAVIKYVRH